MRFFVVCAVILAGISPAFAHHVAGHGGAEMSALNPYSSQSRPPETFLDFSFNVDHLDGGLGYVLTNQLAGEYAVTHRISVGGRVPILSIRGTFLPPADGVGDIALSIKGLAGAWSSRRLFFNIGTEVSFPTGNKTKGTGSGEIQFSPYVTMSWELRPSFFFLFSAGTTLAAADPVRPSIDYGASLVVPVVKGALPVDAALSFQGSTVTGSDTFADGSTKAYLKPAVILRLTPKLGAVLAAKVVVLDTLRLKPDIVLSHRSTVPLRDVDAGGSLSIDYSF